MSNSFGGDDFVCCPGVSLLFSGYSQNAFSKSPIAIKRGMLQISQKNLQILLPGKGTIRPRYTKRIKPL
jgi:hypothetical protein